MRQAADRVLAEAKPADDELAALREAFVPMMVRVNDQGEYVRRPARWDALPAKSHPLLERLAKARLLVVRQDGDARVVEVAHEALLRKWPLLRSWLDAEREFLIGRQQLEQDVRDWEKAAEADKAGALLTGLKLNRARGWLVEHPTQLTAEGRRFIHASIKSVEAEDRRKARSRRLVMLGSLAAVVVLAIVAAGAVWEAFKANAAQKIATANESRALAGLSQAASLQGHYTDAVKLALAAWPRSAADQRPMLSRTIDALGQALSGPLEALPLLAHEGRVTDAAFSSDGKRVLTVSGAARVWDAASGAPIGKALRHEGAGTSAAFSADGRRVMTFGDNTARVWDAATGAPIGKPMQGTVDSAAFSPDGTRLS